MFLKKVDIAWYAWFVEQWVYRHANVRSGT